MKNSFSLEAKNLPEHLKVDFLVGDALFERIWEDSRFTSNIARDGLIVAIGGGVTGDLAAFIASTYQRGIDLIHIPTTTTAMIDSSVGGKTGLNCLDQVNLIGSYYNPKAIFMDLEFLTTLNNRDYYSGICEAIKMSITSDSEMFDRFFQISQNLINKEYKFLAICFRLFFLLK